MTNYRLPYNFLLMMCMAWCSLLRAQGIAQGPYLGQTPPGLKPQVFAPGIISIPHRSEWIGSFTPDGQEFYFTISDPDWLVNSVMVTSQADGVWSKPTVASFSGAPVDWTALLSPDGQRVFFSSSRPEYFWLTFDVWMSERHGPIWSDPVKLGINFAGIDYAGTCTDTGTLYFASERDGPMSIFRSVPGPGGYTQVERLPNIINARQDEQCPWIAPDESYLIFASNRQGNRDLYISYRNRDDVWTEPMNLGSPVNTAHAEWNPTVTHDAKYLIYARSPDSSNENVDLYWVETRAFLPDPNGPIHNLSSEERFSSIGLAVHYANAGATIVIEPGVYNESITLDKDVTLQSVDPNDPYYTGGTIIQASLDTPVVTLNANSAACTLAGLTLRAGSVGVTGCSTHATLRNCRIMDNAAHGLELFEGSEPTLEHCLITANTQAGIMMHAGQGRRVSYCKPKLHHCCVLNNGEGSLIGGQPVLIDSFVQGQ